MDQGQERFGADRGHHGLRPIWDSRGAIGLAIPHASHHERTERLFGKSVAPTVGGADSLRDQISLTGRRVFYAPNDIHAELPAGMTIDEMLVAVGWPDALRPFTLVYIDGMEVLEQRWRYVRPRQGRKVFVGVRPAGKSSKKILAAVATIAIMVAAWYAAPLIVASLGGVAYAGAAAGAYAGVAAGTALSTTSLLVAGGLSMVGTLAIGALVKPPSVGALTGIDTSSIGSTSVGSNSGTSPGAEAKSYGLSTPSNNARPYSPVPRVLGRHRMSPNLAAETYFVSEGGVQTAYMLMDFGEGPLFLEDLRIGTTPIDNFAGVQYRWHPTYKNGDALTFYSGDQATSRVESSIEKDVELVRTAPQSCDQVAIEIQAPSGLVAANSAGELVNTIYNVEIYAALDGQPWTPIRWFNPTILYRGDQGVGQGGFQQIGQIGIVGLDPSRKKFRIAYPNTVPAAGMSILATDGNYYRVTLFEPLPPDGFNDYGKPWWEFSHAYLSLDGWPSDFTVATMINNYATISMFNTLPTPAQAGTWDVYSRWDINDALVQFNGRTKTAQSATITFALPYRGLWKVRVVGKTDAFVGTTSINQLNWNSIRAIRNGNPVTPRTQRSLLEVKITASENINGQIGAFSALVTSIVQLWTGDFYPVRNPAYLVLDVLTGPAAVKKVPWDEINIGKFFEWAQWCYQLAPQGDVRCTCDMIVDTRTTVGELVTLIASCGRAAITIIDGKYDVLMEDEVRVPVQLFTERNTRGSSATRTWVDQPDAVKVTYVDENTWEKSEIYVYADGFDASTATKFETLDLTGCTRGYQAWRDGRYYMAASELRREVVEFETDIESIVCSRGDLVLYSHDLFYGSVTARVMGPGSRVGSVKLDVTWETLDFTTAEIRYSDGRLEKSTIYPFGSDEIYRYDWEPKGQTTAQEANKATPGTPGVVPPGWAITTSSNGITRSILSVGVEGLQPYFDVRFSGTPTVNTSYTISPSQSSAFRLQATLGDKVTISLYIRKDGGDFPISMRWFLRQRDAANVVVGGNNNVSQDIPVGESLADSLIMASFTFNEPTAVEAEFYYSFVLPAGVPANLLLRVGNVKIYKEPAVTTAPTIGDLVTLGKTQEVVEEWLVDSVIPADNLAAKVRLIERRPEILLADRGAIPPYVPPGGNGTLTPIAPPTNLILSYYEAFHGGRPVYKAKLNWTAPVGVIVSRYEVFDNLDSETSIGQVLNPPFEFMVDRLSLPRPNGEIRSYWVELVTPRGRRAKSARLGRLWVPETDPPVILRFSSNVVGTQALLFWEVQGTPDLSHYQIRFADDPAERDWTKMTIAIESVSGAATTATFLRRTGTYAIRASDTGGNWSAPAYTVIIVDYPEERDLYTKLTGNPGWTGVFDKTAVNSGELELTGDNLEGWWYADASAFETATWRFRVRGEVEAYAIDSQEPDDWNAEIWVSSLGQSPVLSSAWFQPLATAVPLAGVASNYQPIRALQTSDMDATIVRWAIRLTRRTTKTKVKVKAASLILDLVERTEFGVNVDVPPAGVRVNFGRSFFRPPSVGITIEGGTSGSGNAFRFTKASDLTGFYVQAFDVNNQGVACQIDWQATGYGRQF